MIRAAGSQMGRVCFIHLLWLLAGGIIPVSLTACKQVERECIAGLAENLPVADIQGSSLTCTGFLFPFEPGS